MNLISTKRKPPDLAIKRLTPTHEGCRFPVAVSGYVERYSPVSKSQIQKSPTSIGVAGVKGLNCRPRTNLQAMYRFREGNSQPSLSFAFLERGKWGLSLNLKGNSLRVINMLYRPGAFRSTTEAEVQAELYRQLKFVDGIDVFLERKLPSPVHRSGYFHPDVIIVSNEYIICAIECKRDGKSAPGRRTRQRRAYYSLGVPVYYCMGFKRIKTAIKFVLDKVNAVKEDENLIVLDALTHPKM